MNPKLNDYTEKKSLFVTALVVTCILFGMNTLFPSPEREPLFSQSKISTLQPTKEAAVNFALTPQIDAAALTENEALPYELEQSITFKNDYLSGTYNVQNGRIDKALLTKYKETTEKNSPFVQLLNKQYYTQTQWESPDVPMPPLSVANEQQQLTPHQDIIIYGENAYVRHIRRLSLDENYLISVHDEITNLTGQPIRFIHKSEVSRHLPELPATSNVHEGFIAVLKDRLLEENYKTAMKEAITQETSGGWLGITDKYWQTAFVLENNEQGTVRFEMPQENIYKASFTGTPVTVAPNQTHQRTGRIFAGAKNINILSAYQEKYQIPKFDLTIDFGWFYFLTKPFLYILNWLYAFLGNMGIAILVFATLIRALLLPIATKSYESMAKMRKLQPQMQALQTRYKEDKARLQIEMLNLYKREKVSPASGCLPMFLQIPVFYALYKVLSVSIDMRQAPFYGWINDLSMPDPSSVFTAFGYLDWPIPAFLNIGILPILMGITMYVQQKLGPAPSDPAQGKVLKWMPVVFTLMLGGFAAGLVIYWTWSNLLSILQQKYIMHKVGSK